MNIRTIVSLTLLGLLPLSTMAAAPLQFQRSVASQNPSTIDVTTYVDANSLLMFVTNKGSFAYDQGAMLGKSDGLYYPYFGLPYIYDGVATKTVFFAAGLWIGGINAATGDTLVSVAEYSDDYFPGPMESGTFIAFADILPQYRVYKLHGDSLGGFGNTDYHEWPVDQGAPVYPNGELLMRGDQMLWTVYNDANPATHFNDASSNVGLGIEIQQTVWAFDEPGLDTLQPDPFLALNHQGSSGTRVSVEVLDPGALDGHQYMVQTEFQLGTIWVWHLKDLTTGSFVLENQLVPSTADYGGFRVSVADAPMIVMSWEWDSPDFNREITGVNWGGSGFFGGLGLGYEFFGSSLDDSDYVPIEVRWENPGAGQSGYCYRRDLGYAYDGYHPNQDITVWDISGPTPRQVNFAFVEHYDPFNSSGRFADSVWNGPANLGFDTCAADFCGDFLNGDTLPDALGGREYLFVLLSDYSPSAQPQYETDQAFFDADVDFSLWASARSNMDGVPEPGSVFRMYPMT